MQTPDLKRVHIALQMPFHARSLAFAMMAIFVSINASAQTVSTEQIPTLSISETLDLAATRSSAILAQDAAAQAARERAVSAAQLPDPMLKFGFNNVPISGPSAWSLSDEGMTMSSIGLMQTYVQSDKRNARAARFERQSEVAASARAMQLANLRRAAAMAWFDLYYQAQIIKLLQQQSAESVLQIEAAESAFRSGRGAQSDVFLARSAQAKIADRIRETQARQANARTNLQRWAGKRGDSPLANPPDIKSLTMVVANLDHDIAQHPDIVQMNAREAQALAEAEVARQEKSVDWNFELMYSQRGPNYDNMMSFNVTVPIQWNTKNRQDREVAASLSMAENLRAEREEMLRQHTADTQRWLQTWRSNLDRLADYDKTLIPLAADRKQAALSAYRGGVAGTDLAKVLEARRMEIDIQMERVRIEMETAALWATLEYLIPPAGSDKITTNTQSTITVVEEK